MASFSERMGVTPPKAIQHQSLDIDLRNSLWNVCYQYWFTPTNHLGALADDNMYQLAVCLQKYFYKQPVNMLTYKAADFVHEHLMFFHVESWFRVLNLIEFLRNQFPQGSIGQQEFEKDVNAVLEREKSPYRFIAGDLADITNEVEIGEIEVASQYGARFLAVSEHINTALHLYAKKPEADYRNSILRNQYLRWKLRSGSYQVTQTRLLVTHSKLWMRQNLFTARLSRHY
jgi:AbiJ N-terminal domain 4